MADGGRRGRPSRFVAASLLPSLSKVSMAPLETTTGGEGGGTFRRRSTKKKSLPARNTQTFRAQEGRDSRVGMNEPPCMRRQLGDNLLQRSPPPQHSEPSTRRAGVRPAHGKEGDRGVYWQGSNRLTFGKEEEQGEEKKS